MRHGTRWLRAWYGRTSRYVNAGGRSPQLSAPEQVFLVSFLVLSDRYLANPIGYTPDAVVSVGLGGLSLTGDPLLYKLKEGMNGKEKVDSRLVGSRADVKLWGGNLDAKEILIFPPLGGKMIRSGIYLL